MSTFVVFLILMVPLITLCVESARLTPLVVTSISLTPVLLGYAELDERSGTHTALLYCGAITCFIVGSYFHQRWSRSRTRPLRVASNDVSSRRTAPDILFFVGIVVALAFYHFFASGIPLFSEDVEITRFDFTSSGLFGIPGRMFLFGLPFVVLLVSLVAARRSASVSRALVYFVWVAYGTASLLGGFKGGLVTVLSVMLLARSVVGRPLSLGHLMIGWRVFAIALAVACCALIAFRYRSLGLTGPEDVVSYLSARATVSAAAPGYLVFSRYGTEGSGGVQFMQDANYFSRKYLPFLPFEEDTVMPFDKTVSAALYHTPISRTSFIVPVTVGAFPELVANIGATAALCVMLAGGALLSYLVARSQRSRVPFKGAMYALAVHLLQIYVLNGNLVYTCFNLVLMGILLRLLYQVCKIPWTGLAPLNHGLSGARVHS